jgi:hypothetical protein
MTDPMHPGEGAEPHERTRCTGTNRQGQPCGNPPVQGATVCRMHGGSAPQVKAAAARRVAHAEWAGTYGEPIDTDPTTAVLDQLANTAGHVAWLLAKVRETEPGSLVWGTTSETDKRSGQWPGVDVTRAARASVWLELYGQERDRLVRMAKTAHDMGISDRQVALAERLGATCLDLISGVLDDLDLTSDQRAAAAESVPRRLQAVAAALTTGSTA